MNGDGNEKVTLSNPFYRAGGGHQNFSLSQAQVSQRGEAEKQLMETMGRGFSDLYRNSSEEIILKSLMENPIGISAPSMEMLGFKNISQTLRGDSEELFNSWLLNGEARNTNFFAFLPDLAFIRYHTDVDSNNLLSPIPGFSSSSMSHRPRQASRRISTELSVCSSQQNGAVLQTKNSNDGSCQQNSTEEHSDPSQRSLRNAAEKGMQASNLYLAKAWFHSTQPMTRSRSSELRRRYAAMQNLQTPTILESPSGTPGQGNNNIKQEFPSTTNFCDISMGDMPNHLHTFTSPSNSSTSPFNTPSMQAIDTVSSVVSMLKGTLERKKLGNQAEKESFDGSFGFYTAPEVSLNVQPGQDVVHQGFESQRSFHTPSSIHMNDPGKLPNHDRSLELRMEGFINTANQMQLGAMSQEPSQSESSAAAPGLSTGFEVCDGPAQSAQTLSACESSRKHVGNCTSERGSKAREFRDRMLESNSKDDRKRGALVRMGSVSSGGSGEKGDPTKKRRVERSRKMAEAKERNSTPALPSDMQSVLKRCENLEKEVRSLKLNLAFMNRKDSEQTKQIEELQKQNEDLAEEKERLLEEIERIISETGKM